MRLRALVYELGVYQMPLLVYPEVKELIINKVNFMTDQASTERRTAIRLPFDAPLVLTLNNTTAEVEGKCSNMSGSGILVSIDVPIATDVKISVHLKNKPEKFSATGDVVRLVEDEGKFLAAIKFREIKSEG